MNGKMASKRFPGNTHNFTRYLILALDALEHHFCLESFVLMPLPSLLMKNVSVNLENKPPAGTDLYSDTDVCLH